MKDPKAYFGKFVEGFHSFVLRSVLSAMIRVALKLVYILVVSLLGSSNALSQGYGIFDARALAMGGTTVANASTDHAQFYNPALLSFHDGREEKTRDGRVYYPMLSAQFSDALKELIELENDGLEDDLTNSVDAFNADPSAQNAEVVLTSSEQLLDTIERVQNEEASFDGFFGMSVSEPGDRQGGAFFLGVRAIGGAAPDITDTDLALLEDYVEALEFVSSGGSQGVAHPELFDAGGALIDPSDNLTSSAEGRGVALLEFGVSLSSELSVFGAPIAFGVTPKLMVIRTYEVVQTINGDGIDTESDDQGFQTFNVDVGVAAEFGGNLRLGLAVKDVVSKRFETELGGEVRIEPKARLGLGYVSDRFQIGLDYDLATIEPVGTESALQELALGAEWKVADAVYLRVGYRHDLEQTRADILSAGVGLEFQKLLFDFTYGNGSDGNAAAFQVGYAF